MKNPYHDIEPYITRDGPEIPELLYPGAYAACSAARQSLSEIRVTTRTSELPEPHGESGEIYHIVSGRGRMKLGEAE